MKNSVISVLAATGLFAVVHSALASRFAKQKAAEVLGERRANGMYRLFFVGQSLASSGALALYIRAQSGREIYRIRRPLSWGFRGGQAVALVLSGAAAREIGFCRMAGIADFEAMRRGDAEGARIEAQGPAVDEAGTLKTGGPFAWSRHPLNFWPLVALWLHPRMTTTLLAFNAATTIYLVIGSIHEESRLLGAYGDEYRKYQTSGVAFYVPRFGEVDQRIDHRREPDRHLEGQVAP